MPHLSHYIHMLHPKEYTTWMKYDLQWLSACDEVLRLPGESNGADDEERIAKAMEIPIFYSLEELRP